MTKRLAVLLMVDDPKREQPPRGFTDLWTSNLDGLWGGAFRYVRTATWRAGAVPGRMWPGIVVEFPEDR